MASANASSAIFVVVFAQTSIHYIARQRGLESFLFSEIFASSLWLFCSTKIHVK